MLLFNPEHDICLANGDANFVPPQSALRFARDCADIMDDMYDDDTSSVVVWGWDAVVRRRLIKQGVDPTKLPSDAWIDRLRQLQHRTSWLALQPDCRSVTTPDEVDAMLSITPHIVLKAPWSGSGRGLRWVSHKLSSHDVRWMAKVVAEQRCVVAEPRRRPLLEFALLYNVKASGPSFEGYSLFETEGGVYRCNHLLEDAAIRQKIESHTERLDAFRTALEDWLRETVCPSYSGPVGADFMVDADGGLYLGEINLRHTMGMVAHAYLRRRPWCSGLSLGISREPGHEPEYEMRCDASRVTLLLGGNQGDRWKLLEEAVAEVERRIGTVVSRSSVYETEPWGFDAQEKFLNQALVVATRLTPDEVLSIALDIEAGLGRVRIANQDIGTPQRVYHSRTMDIDLIFYNDYVVDTPFLQLPHPRMHLRRFVLDPLCEIMPEYRHPVLHRNMSELRDSIKGAD